MTAGYYGSKTDSSIKDLWQTPVELYNNLNQEFNFQCDVAASDSNHLHEMYYDEQMNSLNLPWFDINWCNPPYSDITPWVDKAIEEHLKGKQTVMLIPADTSVGWFKKAWFTCTEVRLISGRISFINAATGKPVNGNNKGSVLFIWGDADDEFNVQLVNRDDLLISIDNNGN